MQYILNSGESGTAIDRRENKVTKVNDGDLTDKYPAAGEDSPTKEGRNKVKTNKGVKD